jgi:hypothetical protein
MGGRSAFRNWLCKKRTEWFQISAENNERSKFFRRFQTTVSHLIGIRREKMGKNPIHVKPPLLPFVGVPFFLSSLFLYFFN